MAQKDCRVVVVTPFLAMAGLAMLLHRTALGDGGDPNATKPTTPDQKAVEAQIWALEHAYWQFNRDADHPRIISCWHDQFLGWPDGEPKPIDKQGGVRYVREHYPTPAPYAFEIEPAGIRVLGNVAVNHYTVHLKWKDGTGKKRSLRITHTWIQEGAGWKMLGGMSSSR
jgi:hypothetical protein